MRGGSGEAIKEGYRPFLAGREHSEYWRQENYVGLFWREQTCILGLFLLRKESCIVGLLSLRKESYNKGLLSCGERPMDMGLVWSRTFFLSVFEDCVSKSTMVGNRFRAVWGEEKKKGKDESNEDKIK